MCTICAEIRAAAAAPLMISVGSLMSPTVMNGSSVELCTMGNLPWAMTAALL